MNGFSLNPEQRRVQEKYRRFAEETMIPLRRSCDEEGRFPHELIDKAWTEGILNGPLPQEYGGGGYSFREACLASEEMGAGCTGIGISIDSHTLAFLPLLMKGSAEQKELFFGRIMHDRLLGAFCLTEPEAGSDIAATQTRAERKGDYYLLNGRKRFITNGEVAGFHTVFAKTDPARKGRGISVFHIPAETPGIKILSRLDKMGQRASVQNEIEYRNVKVPAAARIGQEGAGFLTAMETFNRTRISIGALGLGNARAAWETAYRWADKRIQFGGPITAQEGVSFKLAEARTEIDAARLLLWRAADAADGGREELALYSAMAKYYATDVGMKVTVDAVQIMGGEGYSKANPVEKMLRDAKLCQIYEGTNEIQRVIIAKELARCYNDPG